MGTPDFAATSLEQLINSNHDVVAVVTGVDKKKGRGMKVHVTPVKQKAEEHHLPILQPESLKDESFRKQLEEYKPDIFVVVAFKILPKKIISIPKFGSINLHSSLLPKYRGAAPINWAILNGDKETGITIFQIEPKVDTGDILAQKKIDINKMDTFKHIYDKLSVIGSECLVETLDKMKLGIMTKIKQKDELASIAPKIIPEMGIIDWKKPAQKIKNQIHGLSPIPGAYSHFNKKRIKILRACFTSENSDSEPGTIVIRNKNKLGIQTGIGILFPLELQKEGKKAVPIKALLNGFQGQIGDKFTS